MRRTRSIPAIFLMFAAASALLFRPAAARADFPDFVYQTETEPDRAIFTDTIYSFEYEKTDGDGVITRSHKVDSILTYGVQKNVDLILEIPCKYVRNIDDGDNYSGLDDIGFFPSFKLYDKNGLCFYFIPEMTVPTGNYEQGIGGGDMTFGTTVVVSKKWGSFTLDLNAEYVRNENRVDDRTDIWHASVTPKYDLTDRLTLMANFDIERDRDPENQRQPVLLGIALYYKVNDRLVVYPAFEAGLNRHEKDLKSYFGATFRF